LYFAPKRTAFSGILHYILPQIAQKVVQITVSLNKIHFAAFTGYPLFASKPISARIDYLRQGERLVHRKGTHNVKILAENQTKTIMPCTRS